ncbi:MAG: c-type cytochrome [Rhodobacteraceae bacterium]|nr:MAG: c-type cytochrome [Paracoccaceae bacterium]
MSKFPDLIIAAAALSLTAAPALAETFGLGRVALPEEIAAWDLDVSPDGTGLPAGSGDVLTGDDLFQEKCAVCHGVFAEGSGNWPKLAGGEGTLADKDPLKTVGSYWPYLSTVWDYVHRSMPFGDAQSLSHDEVYAIVAYILYSNDLVDEDFVLSNENFLDVAMPNADGFIIDDRAQTEYPVWRGEPCMTDCKPSVEITMRARVLDVTPEKTSAAAPVTEAAAEAPAAEDKAEDKAEAPAETEVAALDPALVAEGEKVFKKCAACHQVGENAKNRTGPHLNAVFGRVIGGVEDFRYSKGFEAARDEGRVWDQASMAEFLKAPKTFIKGTKMAFAGLKKEDEIQAVEAYLMSFGD